MHLPHPDQALGFIVGERTQQNAMDDRENSGRAPNAEGHRQQGRRGEPTVREQNAKRQPDVLNKGTHLMNLDDADARAIAFGVADILLRTPESPRPRDPRR